MKITIKEKRPVLNEDSIIPVSNSLFHLKITELIPDLISKTNTSQLFDIMCFFETLMEIDREIKLEESKNQKDLFQ